MNREDIIKLARQHGKPVQEQNAEVEYLFTLEGVNALLAAEREACAVAAWSAGMDVHNNAAGLFCDARETGAQCAAAIRARSTR
jgi:hypothetical protein